MKLLRNLLIVFLLLLIVAIAVIALTPAKAALSLMGGRLGPLQLEQVSGTIWRGQAGSATFQGRPLGALDWNVHPTALLARRIDVDLGLQGGDIEGRTLARVAGNNTRLENALITLPAQLLQPAVDIPALQLRGRVEILIEEAELVSGFPRRMKGRADWRDAAVAGEAEALLGTLTAHFQTAADGAIVGTLEDSGGPLQLDGQFRAALTGYEADLLLAARDGNSQVDKALDYVGQRQPDGSSMLEIRGSLLPLQ